MKEQVQNEQERELHQAIQKRASDHFNAMNGDVARGQLQGLTKIQVQVRYLTWQLARMEVVSLKEMQ